MGALCVCVLQDVARVTYRIDDQTIHAQHHYAPGRITAVSRMCVLWWASISGSPCVVCWPVMDLFNRLCECVWARDLVVPSCPPPLPLAASLEHSYHKQSNTVEQTVTDPFAPPVRAAQLDADLRTAVQLEKDCISAIKGMQRTMADVLRFRAKCVPIPCVWLPWRKMEGRVGCLYCWLRARSCARTDDCLLGTGGWSLGVVR